MHSSMQRKYAAKAAHGARGEQGKSLPFSIAQARIWKFAYELSGRIRLKIRIFSRAMKGAGYKNENFSCFMRSR